MKSFYSFIVCFIAVSGYVMRNEEYEAKWWAWKSFHDKTYDTPTEEYKRYTIWRDNLRKIQRHNSEKHSYSLAMNQFGDLTDHEYHFFVVPRAHFRYSDDMSPKGFPSLLPGGITLPSSVDWRTKGCVTPVKNQGMLDQSWSFSVTGSVEGQHCKKTGELVSLSEQNLVDCSGCRDYLPPHKAVADCGFKYIIKNGGIDTEAGYPHPCNKSCCFLKDKVGATITGYEDIQQGNESQLQYAVATVGPISVGFNAGLSSFQFYSGGVYDDPACSSTDVDHAALVVGYGVYQGKDYWLVKNSWGTTWGIGGYIMMSRNKNNQCGIASNASFPLV
ncbi:cathepsin L1-like [Montipora capricornis]|uniref:cathepsin L1-like n=1 Tax=Montipora foliosa TaxID=591990 RepID=UPI0035F14147